MSTNGQAGASLSPLKQAIVEIRTLKQRVAELESRETARAPRRKTAAPVAPVSAEAVLMSADRTAAVPVANRTQPKADAWFETGEGWLGRAGVGLLAVGFIVFLVIAH